MPRIDFNMPTASAKVHHFELAAANRALVLVKRVVADVISNYRLLVDLQEQVEAAGYDEESLQNQAQHNQLVAVAKKLQSFARELDEIGVELKDWSAGVVDFPSMLDGREIYLTWRSGEDRVEYWHEVSEDPSIRHNVADLAAEPARNA